MEWVRENSKPYKLELKYDPSHDDWSDVYDIITGSKKWCEQNNMKFGDDGFFYIRFTNERDLFWFLMRWS